MLRSMCNAFSLPLSPCNWRADDGLAVNDKQIKLAAVAGRGRGHESDRQIVARARVYAARYLINKLD